MNKLVILVLLCVFFILFSNICYGALSYQNTISSCKCYCKWTITRCGGYQTLYEFDHTSCSDPNCASGFSKSSCTSQYAGWINSCGCGDSSCSAT